VSVKSSSTMRPWVDEGSGSSPCSSSMVFQKYSITCFTSGVHLICGQHGLKLRVHPSALTFGLGRTCDFH
jgi:hypothetical protein